MSQGRCTISMARGFEYPARVIESMMIGVPLISHRDKYLDMFFVEDEHYLGFSSVEEMLDKIYYVQTNPRESRIMADKARKLVLQKHRYYHRALQMFGSRW